MKSKVGQLHRANIKRINAGENAYKSCYKLNKHKNKKHWKSYKKWINKNVKWMIILNKILKNA